MSCQADPRSTCLAQGPLLPGITEHSDCPVLVVAASQALATGRDELPALCACECLGCQRAWWDMGRPMKRGRALVTMAGATLA